MADSRGLALADELWSLAKAAGQTPMEALQDPDLADNLTVMRAAKAQRRIRAQRLAAAAKKGAMGVDVILNLLADMVEG